MLPSAAFLVQAVRIEIRELHQVLDVVNEYLSALWR
jgi:hypothetical protein